MRNVKYPCPAKVRKRVERERGVQGAAAPVRPNLVLVRPGDKLRPGDMVGPAGKPGRAKRPVNARAVLRSLLNVVAGVLFAVAISVLLIAGRFYLFTSELLLVRPETIEVKGLRRTDRWEVLKAAGLDRPINYWRINTGAVAAGAEALPWVESAAVNRYFPDGVALSVVEHQPRALVALDQIHYLDGRGRPFKRLDPGENPALPIISGLAVDELLSGSPLVVEGIGQVFRLMDLLAARTDEFRLSEIGELRYDPDLGLSIITRDGRMEVDLGLGAFSEKLIRLGRVAAHLKLTGRFGDAGHLGLDIPQRVTARPRAGAGLAVRGPGVDPSP